MQTEPSSSTHLLSNHTPFSSSRDHGCLLDSLSAHLLPQSTNTTSQTCQTGLVPHTESDEEFLYGVEPMECDGTASSLALRLASPTSSPQCSQEMDFHDPSPLPSPLMKEMGMVCMVICLQLSRAILVGVTY